jgi:hypothetical protein
MNLPAVILKTTPAAFEDLPLAPRLQRFSPLAERRTPVRLALR